MAYFPFICIDCHVEMRYIMTDPADSTQSSGEWMRKCPICDGDKGEVDHWIKHKELDRENLPLLRFLKGKKPA